tara:strand:+ start:15444 stop:16544 length:1101 start_codon:yes stop_codon:yes gene_type:complete
MFTAIITLLSALSISFVAAMYSIFGLMAIFSSAAIAVLVMGTVLEVGKLVTASWLYQNWKRTPVILKSYLTGAVIVLVFVTSMGIFGFLSKAHLDQTASVGDNSLEITNIERLINNENRAINDAELVIKQLDDVIQTLIDYDRIRGKDGAVKTREKQKDEREELNLIINDATNTIVKLNERKIVLEKEQLALELEVGPLKYIAELIYGENAKDYFDEAVRWVIITLIFVFDPLAVLLLIAANQSFKDLRMRKIEKEKIANYEDIDSDNIKDIGKKIDKILQKEQEVQDAVSKSSSMPEKSMGDGKSKKTSKSRRKRGTHPRDTGEITEVKEIVNRDTNELWDKFSAKERLEKRVPNQGYPEVEEDK